MKKLLLLSFLFASYLQVNAQIFKQDFSSSKKIADYKSNAPNSGQFDKFSISGVVNAKIANGALSFTRLDEGAFYLYRNFELSKNPTFVQLKFDFTLSDNDVNKPNILNVFIGKGFSIASSGPKATESSYISRFGISATANAGDFKIISADNIDGAAPVSTVFSGKQTLTYVVNNSGSEKTYAAPDGNKKTLANGKMDVWVGSTKGIIDFSLKNTASPAADITGFKIQGTTKSGLGTFDFDNFEFTDLGK